MFGWGSRDSGGSVVKGEIVNLQTAMKAFAGALEDADNSAGNIYDREQIYFLVSGRGITTRQGEGNVMIYDTDHRITPLHVSEAEEKASSISLAPDQCHLVSFTSYFMLDMNTRVKDPCGHCANRLDAFIHIILADRAKVETMRNAIREFGFEQEIQPVFSGIASAYGTLTHDEKEQGTLLIDIGAGVCDYILVHEDGVLMSGVLPIGMDNLVNDLALGLDLSQDQARKFLLEGRFEQLKRGDHGRRIAVSDGAGVRAEHVPDPHPSGGAAGDQRSGDGARQSALFGTAGSAQLFAADRRGAERTQRHRKSRRRPGRDRRNFQ